MNHMETIKNHWKTIETHQKNDESFTLGLEWRLFAQLPQGTRNPHPGAATNRPTTPSCAERGAIESAQPRTAGGRLCRARAHPPAAAPRGSALSRQLSSNLSTHFFGGEFAIRQKHSQ